MHSLTMAQLLPRYDDTEPRVLYVPPEGHVLFAQRLIGNALEMSAGVLWHAEHDGPAQEQALHAFRERAARVRQLAARGLTTGIFVTHFARAVDLSYRESPYATRVRGGLGVAKTLFADVTFGIEDMFVGELNERLKRAGAEKSEARAAIGRVMDAAGSRELTYERLGISAVIAHAQHIKSLVVKEEP